MIYYNCNINILLEGRIFFKMELTNLSSKRGIYSFYDGSSYIIYSTYYGVVAYSSNIRREDLDNEDIKESVTIDFNICNWYCYWDLKSIITKGINKLEKRFINKNVIIKYKTVKGTDNTLEDKKTIKIKLINR